MGINILVEKYLSFKFLLGCRNLSEWNCSFLSVLMKINFTGRFRICPSWFSPYSKMPTETCFWIEIAWKFINRNHIFWGLPLLTPWFLISCFPGWISPVSLSVFMTFSFPYFEPTTSAWVFLRQLIFLLQCGVVRIFIYFTLFFISCDLVLLQCIKVSILWCSPHEVSFGSQFLTGWHKFKTQV